MPLGGGADVQLAEGTSIRPQVSPDGRLVAFDWLTPERWALAVVPVTGGEPMQVFPLSATHGGRTVRWTADSRGVAFIDRAGGVASVWLQRLEGGPARRLTDFTSGDVDTFDWSPDGSRLVWMTSTRVSNVVLLERW